ncbi:MAG: RpiB/LacA/LacB family sugar-phosphate isomerase [Bacteroidia bacterium]
MKQTVTFDKKIGIASDHAGFEMKNHLTILLENAGYFIVDFGNTVLQPADDYPDYVIPMAQAVANGELFRGIAICGSGVGACITANKIANIRACLITEKFSAKQGVEDDNMNVICLGARVIDKELAWELTQIFLSAEFNTAERHVRRLNKLKQLENH